MKIAIHHRKGSYSRRWIDYCKLHNLDYKIVNAYDSNIIEEIIDCDIFMWHYHHADSKDAQFAKQLLFALEQKGIVVFPNFETAWHFDDKLGQKYLFEVLKLPVAKSYAFYDSFTAIQWAKSTVYPKVFKLRGGAGSANVKLARNSKEAIGYIKKSFSRNGWSPYDKKGSLQNRILLYRMKTSSFLEVMKGFYRLLFPPVQMKYLSNQKGYVYFQDFIPNDGYDLRVEVCCDKCIAMIRKCRMNDFRASGGHLDDFTKENIPKDVIKLAFKVADVMNSQNCALDFVRDRNTGDLFLIENSYCYGVDDDEFQHGYWDRNAVWHNEKFNGLDWIIEEVINEYRKKIEKI